MKKFFAAAIAGVLMLSVTGCFDKKDGSDMVGVATEEEKAQQEAKKAEEEAKKAGEEAEESAEDENEEQTETGEGSEAQQEEELPQIQLPEELSAMGYDSAYVIDHKNMICMPYSSEKYHFNDSAVEEIRGEGHSIYAFVYDFASNFEFGRENAKEKAAQNGAEIQEITIGDFSVVASTRKPYFYTTEYYVDFGGKFGDLSGAFVSVSESRDDKEITLSAEVQDMIANIFAAE